MKARRSCWAPPAPPTPTRPAPPGVAAPQDLGCALGWDGDRLGLATPGHVRACAGGQIAPIFAQQSIREMTRTGRTPQQVMDDATWGIFAEGWRDGVGADADHLKSAADIDACAAAGFTFFTIDPGDHVDNSADDLSFLRLLEASTHLPWDRLDDCVGGLTSRYVGQTLEIEDYRIAFDEATVLRAAVKYGRAVAHVAAMYRHLLQAASGWELEVSVDETETPTTHAEHVYIVSELKRLGVQWVSLAPRYIGRFEKGVDYIGDLAAFQADFAVHAAIARHFGPYKLSLHSGSDKFSVYSIAMQETQPGPPQDGRHLLSGGPAHTQHPGPRALPRDLRLRPPALSHRSRQLPCLRGTRQGAAARGPGRPRSPGAVESV